jgi:NAD(P)-dependent dehydrogenase (short-subunit alcohol dehydrogenase family)
MPATHTDRRVVLLSGATGAIGKAIAVQIAARPQHELVLLCRDQARARAAVREIQALTGNSHIAYEPVDLADKRSIEALARRRPGPIHVLINNAAVTPRGREETSAGIERQLATNVLGYVWMIRAFREQLRAGAPSRVVNVASYWAGDLDLDDLEFTRRRYNNNTAYRQSKQADRMLTVAFAGRLKREGITVNACHPGDVRSTLSNNLGFGGHESPQQGAMTPVWLATEAVGQEQTGGYFERMRRQRCRFGENTRAVEALYTACMAY